MTNHRGFTLIEMVVVIGLTSLVMMTLGFLIVYFYRSNTYVFQQSSATMAARRGIDDTTRYLREAVYSSTGTAPVQTAATSTLVFLADLDHDGTAEAVTYSLASSTLKRTVATPPNGIPPVSTVATYITNSTSTPVFRYYDKNGAELTNPVAVANIASVRTTLVVQIDTNRGPAALTLTGTAVLRNAQGRL